MTTHSLDTSALLERVVIEAESSALTTLLTKRDSELLTERDSELLTERDSDGDLLTASSPTCLEMWRSLRRAS